MDEPFRDAPPGQIVQPCPRHPAPAPAPQYWIEISLIGEDDAPIRWEQYEVKLPDGTVVPGYLDDDGLARLDGIAQAGACHVRFPGLDRDAWTPVAALPQASSSLSNAPSP